MNEPSHLVRLSPDAALVFTVEALYLSAFPPEERRPISLMRELHAGSPAFAVEAILKGESFAGFITTWAFPAWLFVDHFAVDPGQRGCGVGREALELVLSRESRPVILEVELPKTRAAERRIAFYERLGFRLWDDVPYEQPSYAEGIAFVPMRLMSYGALDVAADAPRVIGALHREVYGR